MNILVFHGPEDAVFYHRAAMPYSMMAENHKVVSTANEEAAAQLIKSLDVAVFVGRIDSNGAALMVLCKTAGVPTILDIDDDLFNVPPSNPQYVLWGNDPRIIAQHFLLITKHPKLVPALAPIAQMRVGDVIAQARNRRIILEHMLVMADAVTVTVESLQNTYRDYNDRVEVLPNAIDGASWEKIERENNDKLVLGWAGGNTHYEALAYIEPILGKFLAKHSDVELVTVGVPELKTSLFKDLPSNQVSGVPWLPWPKYQRAIASFDITLAPATNDAFSSGKSPLRAMHANAVGIPVIGSPSTYRDYLRASGGGIVADTQNEWYRALCSLKDLKKRKSLGNQGKKYMHERCTYQAIWQNWAALCASLAVQKLPRN